jgi:hypothetical protein
VGKKEGAGAVRNGRFQLIHIQIVVAQLAVDENGHEPVLNDGVDGGGEAGGGHNHLIPRPQRVAQLWRTEGGDGHQIGRGAGIDGNDLAHAQEVAQFFLEFLGVRAGRQPEVEGGADHVLYFGGVKDAAGVVDAGFAGGKRPFRMDPLIIFSYLGQNRLAQFFGIIHIVCA